MKNKEIEELLNSIDEIIKEAPDEAIYGIQIKEYKQIKNHIEQLENNRDKAIELIEKELKYPPKYLTGYTAIKALNILKGDSDDE